MIIFYRVVAVLGSVGIAAISETVSNFSIAKKGFAMNAIREQAIDFKDIEVKYEDSQQLIPRKNEKAPSSSYSSDTSIYIPRSISKYQNTLKLVFLAYNDSKLFQEEGSVVYQHVISAEVGGIKIENLTEPVVVVFDTKGLVTSKKVQCSWWDFSKSSKCYEITIIFRVTVTTY